MRQLIKALEGGQGSGHFGHAGRPGKVGGSQKSIRHNPAFAYTPEDNTVITRKDIAHFSVGQREIALNIVRLDLPGTEVKALRDSRGTIQAVVRYDKVMRKGILTVIELASTGGGGGSYLMALVSKIAADDGRVLELVAVGSSPGFYKKLGMRQRGHEFTFTPTEAKAFAYRVLGRKLWQT